VSQQTIGTCSLCGGPVVAPIAWYSVTPPVATCSRCGAVAAQHGPVIPMVRPASIPSPFGPTTPHTGTPWQYEPGLAVDVTTDTITIGPYDGAAITDYGVGRWCSPPANDNGGKS